MDLIRHFQNPDNLAHVAYALIACSYVVRDIFFLRGISVVASMCFIMFFVHRETYIPIYWNVGFIVVNGWHIAKIVTERRGTHFNEYETELYQTVFGGLSPVEFMKLMRLAEWKLAGEGEELTHQDSEQNQMMLIFHGRAEVHVGENTIADMRDGDFIGEMAFITGESASATVVVVAETRYLAWNISELKACLDRNPSLRFGLQGIIGEDLSRKLRDSGRPRLR